MPDSNQEIHDAIKQEMNAVWAYIHAYSELFEHPDQRRMELLEETAPSFFALVQTALIECVLIRMARLMDPQESGRNNANQNLSFDRLFSSCTDASDLAEAAVQFAEVCRDWQGIKYRQLKEYRNKVQAHNDFPTIKGAPSLINTKLDLDDVKLIKELFCDLWKVLATAHMAFRGDALIEPRHEALNQLPTAIFPYLGAGLYMEKTLASRPEIFSDFMGFQYAGVGHDKITRLMG